MFHFHAAWLSVPSRCLLLLVILQWMIPVGLDAQDSARGLFGTDEDFSIFYDRLEADISSEDGSRSLVVLGNVILEGRGFSLRADAIGVFLDGVDPETGPIHPRILAIGEVILSRGEQSFRAQTVFLEVDTRRMVLSDARLVISQELVEQLRVLPFDDPQRTRLIAESWVAGVSDVAIHGLPKARIGVQAKHLRVDDFRDLEGEGIVFTTDQFFDPEWALVAERGRARARTEVNQRADEELPGGYLLDVEGARLEIGGFPLLPLPDATWDSRWGRSFPLRDLRVSSSSRFGSRIDTAWNGDFLLPARFEDEIDLTPRIDSLSDRGTGWGLDFEMGRDPRRWGAEPDGRLELYGYGSYWAIEDEATEDSNGDLIADPDRSRARAFFHARMGSGTYIDGELANISDAGFLDEYFRAEARSMKDPENFLSIRQVFGGDYAATASANVRTSDFLSVTERKPEFTFRVLDSELLGPVRWDSDLALSNLRMLPAEGSSEPELENRRADVRTEFFVPQSLSRWVRWMPRAGVRWTSWESPAFDGVDRTQFHAGFEAATRLSRVFGVQNSDWEIDGLRHVIDITAGYSSLFENSLPVAEVPMQIDDIDTLDLLDEVRLSVVQRLQTRSSRTDRERLHKMGTRTIAEARVEAFYYPEADRDHDGQEWGDLYGEMVLHGTAGWSLFSEMVHDLGTGTHRERNGGLRWFDVDAGLFELSWRERPETNETILVGGRWNASSRWDMSLFVEYDALEEEPIGHWWEVGRNFRTFRAMFSLDVERGESDDTTFRIDIGLPEMMGALRGSRFGSSYSGRMR